VTKVNGGYWGAGTAGFSLISKKMQKVRNAGRIFRIQYTASRSLAHFGAFFDITAGKPV